MSAQDTADERPAPGRALAAARTDAGLSTAHVAAAINLRETLVRAIEADDYTLCGGDVYARGHVRAYARLLGLDPAPLLAAYAARSAATTATAAATPSAVAHGTGPVRGSGPVRLAPHERDRVPLERRGPNWPLLGAGALGVLAVFLGVQLVGELRGPARPTQQVATPSASAPAPTSTATAAPSRTAAAPSTRRPTPTAAPTSTVPPDGVVLALRATRDSWVTVRGDSGKTMFAGLLGKGQRKDFTDADSLRVTLGNAGGVQLTVNGRSVGLAGRPGEVKRLTIRPGDPA